MIKSVFSLLLVFRSSQIRGAVGIFIIPFVFVGPFLRKLSDFFGAPHLTFSEASAHILKQISAVLFLCLSLSFFQRCCMSMCRPLVSFNTHLTARLFKRSTSGVFLEVTTNDHNCCQVLYNTTTILILFKTVKNTAALSY